MSFHGGHVRLAVAFALGCVAGSLATAISVLLGVPVCASPGASGRCQTRSMGPAGKASLRSFEKRAATRCFDARCRP